MKTYKRELAVALKRARHVALLRGIMHSAVLHA